EVPSQALLLDAPFAAMAMEIGEASVVAGFRIGAAVTAIMIFMRFEVGDRVLPVPAAVAGQLGPLVVIARLTAHVDHAVDGGAAAKGLSPGIPQGTAVEPSAGLGQIEPVGPRIADAIEIADRDVDPGIAVA